MPTLSQHGLELELELMESLERESSPSVGKQINCRMADGSG